MLELDTPRTAAGAPADDDATVVSRARRDRREFAALYDRYVEAVYRYCHRRLGEREAAEDATSLVFAKALAGLPRYRERSFRSWLFTIAHNVITDALRRRPPERPLLDATEVADGSPSPEDAALAAEEARSVWALPARLPADQARMVELRLAGLNDAEIARVLGRSHGAVRVAQCRALKRLRTMLGVTEEGAGDA